MAKALGAASGFLLWGLLVGGAHASSQEIRDSAQVTILGTVVDFTTLAPIQGVEVLLPGLDLAEMSDSSGGFVFDQIPLGVHQMTLGKEGYITADGPLTVARSGSFVIQLRPANSPEPGSLIGRVVDPSTGEAVGSVMITLRGGGLQRITNDDGRFSFPEVPPGQHLVEIEHMGFASRADSVRVVSGRVTEVEIPLAVQPIEMEPITVLARSKWMEYNGFYRRMSGDFAGKQWTADEIQESGVTHLGDLLEQVKGIRMVWQGTRGLSILSNQGKLSRPRWCRMPLYIDGMRIVEFDLDMVMPGRAAGLEVYHGMKAPLRYSIDNPCGVILVWTR